MRNIFAFALLFASSLSFAQTSTSVVGRWKTIDDETNKPKSIVEISQQGDSFVGTVAEILNPEKVDELCTKCSDDKKDKPIKGLEIMWGMKETEAGKEWADGKILDPNNGKTYKCRLRLKEDGGKLEVRGFIGISLLGRSQTWLREP